MKRQFTRIALMLSALALGFLCAENMAKADDTLNYKTVRIPKLSQPVVYGINDLGQIVGVGVDESGNAHGFLYAKGKLTLLDVPGAHPGTTVPTAINDLGQIVGSYGDDTTREFKQFLFFHGVFTTINLPGNPAAINNYGQIVGTFGSYSNSSLGEQGFKYSQGNVTVIDYPNSFNTGVSGINDFGDIVGRFYDAAGYYHGLIYSNGVFSDPIDFPGASFTSLAGINDQGQIIGGYPNNAFYMRTARFM